MRVLHLPTSVGGNAYGLSRGERQLGLQSDVLIAEQNFLDYPCDIRLNATGQGSLIEQVRHKYQILKAFWQVRSSYDVFHFNFGRSLFGSFGSAWGIPRFLDLAAYPDAAKIFVTYNGCDARQKYPTMARTPIAACHNPQCYGGMCNSGQLDQARREGIARFARYAHTIFTVNPDLFYFLPAEKTVFLPYTIAAWDNLVSTPLKPIQKRIKIAHAPTNRAAKGSDIILNALAQLQVKYPQIEVVLIEGKSNSEALQLYAEADLIIDQILIGWYGGFAVEVMKMGKPVMVYICEQDLQFIDKQMAQDCLNAMINVNPATIYQRLAELIENPQYLVEYSARSLAYVHRWHDPQQVAAITKHYYQAGND